MDVVAAHLRLFLQIFRREEMLQLCRPGERRGNYRGSTHRFNYNWAGGHTAVISPTMVLDLKGSGCDSS